MKNPVSAALAVVIGAVGFCPFARAGSFTADFNSGTVPAGSSVYQNAVVEATGGVGDSGALKLTKAINGQVGGFVVEDLDAGANVNSLDVTFDVRCGGGSATPADGWSFCVGPDLPATGWGEEGPTTAGLVVAFDIYDNGGGEAPAITLRFGGAQLAEVKPGIAAMTTGAGFVPARVLVESDGSLDVWFNNNKIFDNIYLPYQPLGFLKYGFGARTGGLNQNQFIDNLSITTTTGLLTPAVTRQPADTVAVENADIVFSVVVNDPSATIQWQKKGPADVAFADVPGATAADFTFIEAQLADSGTQVRAVVTGDGGNVTSNPATLTVVSIPEPTLQLNADFDLGLPAEVAIYGNAAHSTFGGFADTGTLVLTEAVNGQAGAAVVGDLQGGLPVDGLYAAFTLRMGEGTAPPADGFSFNWANDLPDGTLAVAEEGQGTGLSILFDVYGADGPAIDVKYKGVIVASRLLPLATLQTNGTHYPVVIRLEPDGTLDVAFNGIVYFNNLQLANWSSYGGAKVLLAARTGGLNQLHYVDNLKIGTTLYAGPIEVIDQPDNVTALINTDASFTVTTNDPARSEYQWQIKRVGDPDFADVGISSTSPLFLLESLTMADNGAQVRVVVTGPASSTTSDPATVTVVDLGPPASPQVMLDFNTGIPVSPVISLYGTAVALFDSGVGGTGSIRLVEAINDQSGAFRIEDFNDGAGVSAVQIAFQVAVATGGTPADGFSVNWAPDVPTGLPTGTGAEEGVGSGLRISFDTYDNGLAEAPAIDVKWGDTVLAHAPVPIALLITDGEFVPVYIRLSEDGKVDVAYENQIIHQGVQVPGWSSMGGAHFYFASRTGGANESVIMDNIQIQTTLYVGPISFVSEPQDSAVLPGQTATFSAQVNDPQRTTFQWEVKNPGDVNFSPIAGAESATYTTPALALANDGTQYRVVATANTNTLTSDPATVTVVSIPLPVEPDALFDFNDGFVPAGTTVVGSAAVTFDGGVANSGVMHLTDAVNGVQGSFFVDDLDFGATVKSMIVSWQQRIGGGTEPPADGMSFIWTRNFPTDASFGEEGAGDHLIVAFDIYDNGGAEAPAITLRWGGVTLAEVKPGIGFLRTDVGGVPTFEPVIVRVEEDGTVDVIYKGQIVFYNIQLPGWTGGLAGSQFAWGGRTGGLNENQWIDDVNITTYTDTPVTPPAVDISIVGGNAVITFDGVLQSSPTMGAGTWQPVPGATSPYSIPLPPGEPVRFYRAVK